MQHEGTILTPEFYKHLNEGNIVLEDDERSLGSFQQLSVIHRAMHPKDRSRARRGIRSRGSLSSSDTPSRNNLMDDDVNPVPGNKGDDFVCKLCAKGWTVRKRGEEKSLTPQEIKWMSMLTDFTEHYHTCSVEGVITSLLEYYDKFVRPELGYEQLSRRDIELHLRRCALSPLLEELFQVEEYRRLATRYGDLEAKHLENGETSRQTADMHIKYNTLTMKLLQDREKTIRQKRNTKD